MKLESGAWWSSNFKFYKFYYLRETRVCAFNMKGSTQIHVLLKILMMTLLTPYNSVGHDKKVQFADDNIKFMPLAIFQ